MARLQIFKQLFSACVAKAVSLQYVNNQIFKFGFWNICATKLQQSNGCCHLKPDSEATLKHCKLSKCKTWTTYHSGWLENLILTVLGRIFVNNG